MESSTNEPLSRKRGDSEIIEEDDFIVADKRQKHLELSKCQNFDLVSFLITLDYSQNAPRIIMVVPG